MVEEHRSERAEPERESEIPARPDETEWWEKQLGMPLPTALYTEVATGP